MTKGPQPDTPAALEFLRRWLPGGPWVLTSIVPDGRIDTRTFAGEQEEMLAAWVEKCQGTQNVYFHVNPTMRPLTSKAHKEDVARLAWLHVDIDPRVGEDFQAERARALGLLRKFQPAPTVIVDSGGGYQGFWRLQPEEALEIRGDLSRAEALELYNVQLEKLFGADHCFNVDRIMRLPGTINVPNAKKRKKGRQPALAEVVEWTDNVYPISAFTPAVRVQGPGGGGLSGGAPRVSVPTGNVPDVGVEELQAWADKEGKQLADHTLALIASGGDPNDPTKYPSRSEVLFKVCCDLVRAGVPDEMIFAVITGRNEVASSVRDKPNWERYALRQIERAKEEADNPWLRKLNEKHAVIGDLGGRCRIISEVYDPVLERHRISKQSFEDFRNRYGNVRVVVGTDKDGKLVEKPAGAWWCTHPKRRQYENLVFSPGRDVPGAYNLWKGFACDAMPGNRHESFLHHIRDNIVGGDEACFRYVVGWMARAVQQPASPGETALVMRGAMGTGKSFFAKQFGALFGRHFLHISNPNHLVGNFNAHLRDAVVVFGDEAFYAGDKKHESILKTLVTEETMMLEGKGIDAEVGSNFTHVILASNKKWVVPAGPHERRFFVVDVDDRRMQDLNYFRALKAELDAGGRENLLHHLMSYPLGDFEVRSVPRTAALGDQKLLSMEPEEQWLHEKLQDGSLLNGSTGVHGWPEKVLKDDLYQDYVADQRDQGRNMRLSRTTFSRFLHRAMPKGLASRQEWAEVTVPNRDGVPVRVRKRAYFYLVPPLPEVRAHWDRNFGGPFVWAEVAPQEDAPPPTRGAF